MGKHRRFLDVSIKLVEVVGRARQMGNASADTMQREQSAIRKRGLPVLELVEFLREDLKVDGALERGKDIFHGLVSDVNCV